MQALRAHVDHEGPIEIRSDSTYVVHCFRDSWHVGWKKRGWKNSQRQPVANRDLWEPFIEMVLARGDVTFTWVKAHSGEAMNELVDALAVAAVFEVEFNYCVGGGATTGKEIKNNLIFL